MPVILMMQMPESCATCRLSGRNCDMCCVLDQAIPEMVYISDGRLDNCPLRPLPEGERA